ARLPPGRRPGHGARRRHRGSAPRRGPREKVTPPGTSWIGRCLRPAMSEEALSAAQRSKIRRLSAPAEPQAGDEAGELNVVPYLDIMMNIMMFVLASVSVAFVTTIHTSAA